MEIRMIELWKRKKRNSFVKKKSWQNELPVNEPEVT